MKIVICDDNGAILTEIRQMLRTFYADEVNIKTTMLPENLLAEWQKYPNRVADIVLMDIEYPYSSKNGIDIAGEIQTRYPGVKVVFITGQINYAQDIFAVEPISFIVKPIESRRLKIAIDKAREQILQEKSQNAYFRSHGNVVKIPLETIQYIESDGHHIRVHTQNGSTEFRMKLIECLDFLPQEFWLIHQSYLVHAKYIKKITKGKVELWNARLLPVARSKFQEIKNKVIDEIEKCKEQM